jgi:hypothetical protein
MKLRFGEFPEDHSFLLITRPFVEWAFKLLGWIILTATIRYAYEKTSSYLLLGLTIFAYLLLLGFVDWFRSFKFKSVSPKPAANMRETTGVWKLLKRSRRVVAVIASFAITVLMVGTMNTLVENTIDSIIGHYEKLRP